MSQENYDIWADLSANTGKQGPLWALFYFFAHPGYLAITLHRWAHRLHHWNILGKILSKIFWRLNVLLTQCHISPCANIGPGLHLPHGRGIVIGEGVTIGKNVTLLHNVTLGKKKPDDMRYPTLGDKALVYSGACIFGPVHIGEGSVVGALSVVRDNVPPHRTAVGNPARILDPAQ